MERFPEAEPFDQFHLSVSDLHQLHVRQYGNPAGYPVVHLHGGPGAGCASEYRLFDPSFYHVTLFDQRGCGLSKPYGDLREQNTANLVSDIEKVRKAVGVDSWAVSGGSWGTALACYYAKAHGERIQRMMLRAMFLADQKGAAHICEKGGASEIRPDYWGGYADWERVKEASSLTEAYYKIFTKGGPAQQEEAAVRFMTWDNSIALPEYDEDVIWDAVINPQEQIPISKSWFHFAKREFMKRPETELLTLQRQMHYIDIDLVHGEQDHICPVENAHRFKAAYPHTKLHIFPEAGHSGGDPEIIKGLLAVTERWKSDIRGPSAHPGLHV